MNLLKNKNLIGLLSASDCDAANKLVYADMLKLDANVKEYHLLHIKRKLILELKDHYISCANLTPIQSCVIGSIVHLPFNTTPYIAAGYNRTKKQYELQKFNDIAFSIYRPYGFLLNTALTF